MALQVLTKNEIEAVSGGNQAAAPIDIEAPGLSVGLDPLALVNGVLGLVGGVLGGVLATVKGLLGGLL